MPSVQEKALQAQAPLVGEIVLSIDAMGGDRGPAAVVAGIAQSAARDASLRFIVHGDEAQILPLVTARGISGVCEIRHAADVVTMEDKPSAVLRSGKSTSMWSTIEAVRSKEAAVAVSCGNTGALMAISMIRLRKLPGVNRPAIACLWPSHNPQGFNVMLDVGADIKAEARDLLQYALMGMSYARNGLGLERPRVGLLNVGTEEHKGRDELKIAYDLIAAAAIARDPVAAATVSAMAADITNAADCARIVEEARKTAKEYLDRQTQEASQKANDMLVKAQHAIELEHRKMLAETRTEIARLVVVTAERDDAVRALARQHGARGDRRLHLGEDRLAAGRRRLAFHDHPAIPPHRILLGLRRRARHHHRAGNPPPPRRIRQAQRMVAAAMRGHAARQLILAQAEHRIRRPAHLERPGLLEILAFEEQFRPGQRVQIARGQDRRPVDMRRNPRMRLQHILEGRHHQPLKIPHPQLPLSTNILLWTAGCKTPGPAPSAIPPPRQSPLPTRDKTPALPPRPTPA